MKSCEKRYIAPKLKRGRTKGVKNGQGKKKPYVKKNVQRGRKGLLYFLTKGSEDMQGLIRTGKRCESEEISPKWWLPLSEK